MAIVFGSGESFPFDNETFPAMIGQMLYAGIIGNGLIIALYLVTRTVGVPVFGPDAGEVEPFGVIDVISKIVELGLIVSLVMLLRAQRSSGQQIP